MGMGAEGFRTASVERVGAWVVGWLLGIVGAIVDDDV